MSDLTALVLSKPMVQALFYQQLHDSQPHELPHGGLFDAEAQSKPALAAINAARRQYL
jgi:hypothetical protein